MRTHCPRCGQRCLGCDERMCSAYGPEPAVTCPTHPYCQECVAHAPDCSECATARREAVA